MKIRELLSEGETSLKKAEKLSARNDALLLLSFLLNMDRGKMFLAFENEAPEFLIEKYHEVIKQRASGVPLQHITGITEFMGLTFKVTPEVLIPRSETELLVEEALKLIAPNMKILELCTGSGCIALSILKLYNSVSVTAADISEGAVYVAKENAKKLGLSIGKNPGKIDFVQGDLFEPVEGTYDLIIVNPPYIKSGDISDLMKEVREHDPVIALDGGPDGLYFYRRLFYEAKDYLNEGGYLLLEIGKDQAKEVLAMAEESYENVKVIKDYSDLDRIIIMKKKPTA
jgi:release factor glutamine methyltransferase